MIALLLTIALAWQLSPPCNQITLVLAPTYPPDGTWSAAVIGADGPWMLCYGGALPGAEPFGLYKGCDLWPTMPFVMIGPFVGDIWATFTPPGPMAGMWQVLSLNQTSNPVHQL